MIFVDIVADYGGQSGLYDLAFTEVKNRITASLIEKKIDHRILSALSVNSFNTIETGFVVAQIALNSHLKNHIVYHNTAPRKDDTSIRSDNDGEKLAMAILDNGVLIIGVCSGYSFSFIKNFAKVYSVDCLNKGSQFRSRDIFPEAMANISCEVFNDGLKNLDNSKFKAQLLTNIPDVPENVILYIDGYGNLKTSIPVKVLEKQKKAKVIINNTEHDVYISNDGIFGIEDGNMVLAKGSSGAFNGNGNNFLEISLRGGSAKNMFCNPKPGDRIVLISA